MGNQNTTMIKTGSLDVSIAIYRHMAKDCWKLKKEKETRKCYKCDKVEHLAKDCRTKQKMKNRSMQKDIDKEDNNKKKDFVKNLE